MNKKNVKLSPYFFVIVLVGIISLVLYINRNPSGCFDVCVFSPIIFLPFILIGGALALICILLQTIFNVAVRTQLLSAILFLAIFSVGSFIFYLHLWGYQEKIENLLEFAQVFEICRENIQTSGGLFDIKSFSVQSVYNENSELTQIIGKVSLSSKKEDKYSFSFHLENELGESIASNIDFIKGVSFNSNEVKSLIIPMKPYGKNAFSSKILIGNLGVYNSYDSSHSHLEITGKRTENYRICKQDLSNKYVDPVFEDSDLLIENKPQ